MMRGRVLLGVVVAVGLAGVAGCREKTPYPKVVAPGSVPDPDRVPATVLGEAPAEPVPAAPEPVRPWLLVETPEGSFLVASRPGGADLAVRRTSAVVRVTDAGVVRGLRVRTRDIAGGKAAQASNLAALETVGFAGASIPAGTVAAEDIRAAFEADPDMAAEFSHRESLVPLGVRGRASTWLATTRGYLGGAHPYATANLVVVDLESGRAVPTDPGFGGRDLVSEALGARAADACVRHPVGVAPVEGLGGDPAWMAGFSNEFESCAGEFAGVRVAPPSGEKPATAVEGVVFAQGTLTLSRTEPPLTVAGVADWRASPDGTQAVLLMARDRKDGPPLPWSRERTGGRRPVTRELRAWEAGMERPAVIGRASAVLSVQFLDGHPAPERIVQAFEAL